MDKLLRQLASEQTIVVNVYDTTNASTPIKMYGTDAVDTGLFHNRYLDFGDPSRKHEMHCRLVLTQPLVYQHKVMESDILCRCQFHLSGFRFKEKPPLPWTAINTSMGVLVITLLLGHIFHAAINRIVQMENDCHKMEQLKARAEAADVAKSQVHTLVLLMSSSLLSLTSRGIFAETFSVLKHDSLFTACSTFQFLWLALFSFTFLFLPVT